VTKLKSCCQGEARKHLKRHQAVAICDGCRQLLLAYDNDDDYEKTRVELEEQAIEFQFGMNGKLRIISKIRGS
jgi:hypothetical protein